VREQLLRRLRVEAGIGAQEGEERREVTVESRPRSVVAISARMRATSATPRAWMSSGSSASVVNSRICAW
jgi:hypothetical protein